ncbi:MAG TPA: chloride channel protein [Flavisolibacter sp.]|jgi:H+/Cl- antiporter ClcA|nr:chloride channel protein [Flavisolibacter sp.]
MKRELVKLRRTGKFFFDLIGSERIRRNILQALPFWFASLLTGLIAVAYTKMFAYSEGILQNILHWHSWFIFIMTPVCFFLAWLTIKLFAINARGSGIPQVMAAIELSTPKYEYKIDKLLSLRIILTKIVSSLLMVLGGGAIGREGPTIQIAGSVFRMVNKWTPSSWPKLSKQSFILTGAAAGLAAAFNTPLGGVVFAMEELAKIHIRFFRTALFSAVIIAGLTAQGLLGPYLYLGYPEVGNLKFTIFFGVATAAIVAGIAGSLTSKGILKLMRWKQSFNITKTIVFIIVAGLVIATLAFFVNSEILGSGKNLMNTALFTDRKYYPWHTMIMRMIGSIICFNTGAAGGVFAPALAAGASIGSYVASVSEMMGSNANILILSGMVGFLTGVTRTPFTSAILVLEMTDRHSVIFHLMLAAMLSNMAALIVDKHSLYEQLKKDYVDGAIDEKEDTKPFKESPAREKKE